MKLAEEGGENRRLLREKVTSSLTRRAGASGTAEGTSPQKVTWRRTCPSRKKRIFSAQKKTSIGGRGKS